MHIFNEEDLCNDDKLVKLYTGFSSFKKLRAVYTYVSKDIVHGTQAALTLFQQFIMVLLKLRLNLSDQDIAYRFGIHQSTVSTNESGLMLCTVGLNPSFCGLSEKF